jgi:hypothetical protein
VPLILKRSASKGTAATDKAPIASSIGKGGNATNFAAAPTSVVTPSASTATAPEQAVGPKKLVIKAAKPPEKAPEAVIKEWPPVEIPVYVPHKALFLGQSPVECTFCKHPYMQPCNGEDKSCGNYAAAAQHGAKGGQG